LTVAFFGLGLVEAGYTLRRLLGESLKISTDSVCHSERKSVVTFAILANSPGTRYASPLSRCWPQTAPAVSSHFHSGLLTTR
jgi:hypothetical protein